MKANFGQIRVMLIFVAGLASCTQRSIEQYDLVPSAGVTIVQAKTNSLELSKFTTASIPVVFSMLVDRSTGNVTLYVEAGGEFPVFLVDCDTARIEYAGKAYKTIPNTLYSGSTAQPIKCRSGQVVDGFQKTQSPAYTGAVSIEFNLPAPVTGSIALTLPSVFLHREANDRPESSITVTFQLKKFVEGGGWH